MDLFWLLATIAPRILIDFDENAWFAYSKRSVVRRETRRKILATTGFLTRRSHRAAPARGGPSVTVRKRGRKKNEKK
ncbi:hypothetical protein MPNT_70027 [Candidatus Methylacidithermus pantelleriae]|uniref:Uncharacterized protein n=1 Tax=Candidatus Methylacidithermus pantelleriae TaxID=2744239 RepID=A0A8J2FPQ0_9BACT|nr:hypothetical protein MPNT_70027 [Candidatus Methylacidithermus pantelleriae]